MLGAAAKRFNFKPSCSSEPATKCPRPLNRTGLFGGKRQRANRAGMVVASLNMSASTSRMTDQIIIGKVLPRMKDAAEQMSKLLP